MTKKKHARDFPVFEDRFWSKVKKTDSCWIWTGGLSNKGYGQIQMDGKTVKAHRASWILHRGPIPDDGSYHGVVVMHKCDNPSCVNPDHLTLGTVGDNNRDRQQKGRTKNIDEGRSAHHAAQRAITHCPAGHEYSGTNVRYRKTGARYCGECARLRCAQYTKSHGDERNANRRQQRQLQKEFAK